MMEEQKTYGAQWYRCDLHVHTPFDKGKSFPVDLRGVIDAFKKEDDPRLREVAQSFIEACDKADGKEGLDLIAITDHNSIEGYKTLKPFFDEIIQEKKKKGQHYTAILPGVELSVGSERNVHFLIIFSQKTEARNIEGVISYIFGSREPFDEDGRPQPTGKSISEFLSALSEWCHPPTGDRDISYLVIPAHSASSQGVAKETGSYQEYWRSDLWEETQGKLRELAINRKEWHGFQTKRPFERLPEAFQENICRWYAARRGWDWDSMEKERKDEIRKNKHWPLLEASDPNDFEGIGTRFSWLKLENRDLEGIRLALLDPESRLRRMNEGHPRSDYPLIKRIQLQNTDFFEDVEVCFNPSLNTLIGGRGSGKSSILETIRHLAGKDRKSDFIIKDDNSTSEEEIYAQVASMLQDKEERDLGETPGIFLNDSVFTVDVVSNGITYRMKKSRTEQSFHKIDEDAETQPIPFEDVKSILDPTILSQQQIASIAKDPAAQRREIDLLIDADKREKFQEQKRDIIRQIKTLQNKRDRLIEEQSSLPSKRTDLIKTKEDIAYLEQEGNTQILENYQQLQKEQEWLENNFTVIDDIIELLTDTLEDITSTKTRLTEPEENASGVLLKISEKIHGNFEELTNEIDELITKWNGFKKEITNLKDENWEPQKEVIEETYKDLLQELEDKGIPFDKHEKMVQRRALLKKEVNRLENLTDEIKQTDDEIKEQRKKLIELHNERIEDRKSIAQYLAKEDADIRFSVIPFNDRKSLEMKWEGWFRGTRIRESDWKTLVDFCFQSEEDVEKRLHTLFQQIKSDIELSQQKKDRISPEESEVADLLSKHGLDSLTGYYFSALETPEQFRIDEMEYFLPEDEVKTQVRTPGGEFKPISQGSIGQKSTAILSLLLSAGDQPLIIDQPENDLDNQYIYDVVVDLLRKKKFQRQIIIATHNANIPVNGDAEQIITLEVNDKQMGEVGGMGSIDKDEIKEKVSLIMEGSQEAFRLRKERYGY